ncbi:MAG: nucleotidyltransferase domain-containing protein [Clostridia bacterium]|nr:nucleotidyltransferase domain-containing protein [Clostridia bacterium]
MLTRLQIEEIIRTLLKRYHADHALLFGSYARGEEKAGSDIDVIVFGGADFKKTDIFAFGEELRLMTGKDADVFEICELDEGTPFYENVLKEGVKIA